MSPNGEKVPPPEVESDWWIRCPGCNGTGIDPAHEVMPTLCRMCGGSRRLATYTTLYGSKVASDG